MSALPVERPQGSEEAFLSERRTGIGGSDAHHVHSAEPYGCARWLWYEKLGIEPDEPKPMTGPMRRGLRLEEIAADFYEEKTGRALRRVNKVARHPEHPELLVHMDRVIVKDERGPGYLELKTVGQWMWQQILTDGAPDHFLLQVQHGLMVKGYRWGSFGIYWPDGDQLMSFDVDRNEKLIAGHKEACLSFWRRVRNDDPPPRLDVSDDRCKSCNRLNTCQGPEMANLLNNFNGKAEEDASLLPILEQYQRIKPIYDQAEEEYERVKAHMRQAMGSRLVVAIPAPGYIKYPQITYKPQTEWDIKRLEVEKPTVMQKYRTKYDLTALSEEQPHLKNEFRRPSVIRPLRIHEGKKK